MYDQPLDCTSIHTTINTLIFCGGRRLKAVEDSGLVVEEGWRSGGLRFGGGGRDEEEEEGYMWRMDIDGKWNEDEEWLRLNFHQRHKGNMDNSCVFST